MKSQKISKKLSLNKQHIADLNSKEMFHLVGGKDVTEFCKTALIETCTCIHICPRTTTCISNDPCFIYETQNCAKEDI